MDRRYPSELQDRFMVRLPEGMREQLKAAATATKRTMNAEIVARLEASLEEEANARSKLAASRILAADLSMHPSPENTRLTQLEERVRKLETTIKKLAKE